MQRVAASGRAMDESSLRYPGWRVVVACFTMTLFGFGFGFYGHSVYLAELTMGEGGTHRSWEPVEGGGRALVVLFVLMGAIAGLTGVFVAEAQQFSFLGTGQGAPVIDVNSERTILPQADGWTLTHVERIGWSDLYGDSSRGDLFAYAYPNGPTVIAQVVVADQKEALDRYSIVTYFRATKSLPPNAGMWSARNLAAMHSPSTVFENAAPWTAAPVTSPLGANVTETRTVPVGPPATWQPFARSLLESCSLGILLLRPGASPLASVPHRSRFSALSASS